MTRKNALRFLIIPLLAVLVLPFTAISGGVAKASTSITVPRSVEFCYEVQTQSILNADSNDVTIEVDDVVVYTNGAKADVTEGNVKDALASISYKDGVIVAKLVKTGAYTIEVFKTSDTANVESVEVTVTTDASTLAPIKYLTANGFDDYKGEILKNAKTDESNSLKVGDEFQVPSLKDIVEISTLAYDSSAVQKTVHYASNGSTYYATTTSDKFTISSVGTYKFYVTFKTDALILDNEDSILELSEKYLVEKQDGFYMPKNNLGERVYAVKQADGEYKYYPNDEIKDDEVIDTTANPITSNELVIPIFSFEIESTEPSITSNSTYQENGYVDYEYDDISFTAKGNDITTTYVLKYSSDDGATWVDAEEELSSSLSFTPKKLGLYKVVATVLDCEGKSDEAETAIIKVADKYVTVEFETSFSDWLSVNTVPFIFLCISALCLIGIILILFIKPKEKVKEEKATEEDR